VKLFMWCKTRFLEANSAGEVVYVVQNEIPRGK
jgi:hypothetical protein